MASNMDYKFEKETPKDTEKKDAKKTKLKLTTGTIKQVSLFHPMGCKGYAYAAVYEGGHQLYPTNREGAYHGDGIPNVFPDNYELKDPAELTLKTWNLSTKHPHTVYVRITVIRPRLDVWQQAFIDMVTILKRLVGIS